MGLRLSLKELATALTTLGLTWGRPTQRQMTEAFDQFGQLHELYGEDEAIGMVAGMLGFKSTAAARKQIVEAGHLEARKRGRPAGLRARSGCTASASSTDSGSESVVSSKDSQEDDGMDPDARCVVCGEAEVGSQGDMLFCDGCNACFHMSCLTPPLTSIPTGYWFCRNCKRYRPTVSGYGPCGNGRGGGDGGGDDGALGIGQALLGPGVSDGGDEAGNGGGDDGGGDSGGDGALGIGQGSGGSGSSDGDKDGGGASVKGQGLLGPDRHVASGHAPGGSGSGDGGVSGLHSRQRVNKGNRPAEILHSLKNCK
ncbi:hypothetical protein Vretifemale_11164 [Volvox reticuliferus]|uniref:PHD-type domain-containing protein n=1 Tax=Volvox reticuliferus TaxID=1737510 RepID=A0A8J4CJJ0_9CHLO|nr:hypothetical protein Vretifemale_11164 [Volvox reticuliferus]